jgi:hypothetical protein
VGALPAGVDRHPVRGHRLESARERDHRFTLIRLGVRRLGWERPMLQFLSRPVATQQANPDARRPSALALARPHSGQGLSTLVAAAIRPVVGHWTHSGLSIRPHRARRRSRRRQLIDPKRSPAITFAFALRQLFRGVVVTPPNDADALCGVA